MEQAEKKVIKIECCGQTDRMNELAHTLELFIPALKEPVEFTIIDTDIERYVENHITEEGVTLIIDDPELLPEPEYYQKKASRVYYYIDSIRKTESWIRDPLIDGVIFKGSDTTIKCFLEDVIFWNYRIFEKEFPKPIRPWVKTLQGDVSILTVSYGKMARVYNELKTFAFIQNLNNTFSDIDAGNRFAAFVSFMKSIQSESFDDSYLDLGDWLKEFEELKDQLRRKHIKTVSILLTGESGVGKSLIAGFVRNLLSKDGGLGPLTKINCSQMGKEQIRTELFGAMPGSYTGQLSGMPGRILENALGLIILDEIADLDVSLQPQLLSYLDDSETLMLHAPSSIYCPVVCIGTTNKNITQEIERGNFRKDLYQRFDLHLEIPSVRDRRDEIKPFIKMTFSKMYEENPRLIRSLSISKACLIELCSREYREGNFREIHRTVQHAVRRTLARGGDMIMVSDLYE